MLRSTKVLMVLPMLALAVAWVPAQAATLSAEEGLHILAKAKAADTKCGFLSGREHRELSGYLARAQVASRNLMSGAAVNSAVAEGRKSGRALKCNESVRNDVEETLVAARLAVAEADGRPARPNKAEKPAEPVRTGAAAPAEYRSLTKPYFVDLRCRQLSSRRIALYFEAVKSLQKASVARYGVAAISAAQSRAQKEARGVACGPGSKQMAEAGLTAILRK